MAFEKKKKYAVNSPGGARVLSHITLSEIKKIITSFAKPMVQRRQFQDRGLLGRRVTAP